jgi:hypothetical protein
MYSVKVIRRIYRTNCSINCIKYLEVPVIPRKDELMCFSDLDTGKVREVIYDIPSDNSVKIHIVLGDMFSRYREKIFTVHDCFDLIYYDHVWVMSGNIEEYTLYKTGYDGERPIVFNKEVTDKFEKNFG